MPVNQRRVALRSLLQWRLRSVLLFVTAVGLALTAWRAWADPLRQDAAVVARLRSLGASVKTAAAGPEWLRSLPRCDFRQATFVDLGPCYRPILATDFAALSKLHAVRELRFGNRIDKATLSRLHHLPQLETISLANTNITDADLHFIRDARQLKRVELGRNVTIAGMEGLADARPDLVCGFSESLYLLGLDEIGRFEPMTLIYDFEVAARCKLACARFKSNPEQAKLAALRQLVHNYDLVLDQTVGFAKFSAVIECARVNAQMRLHQAIRDEGALPQLASEAWVLANTIRAHAWQTYEANCEMGLEVLHLLELCREAEVTASEVTSDLAARTAACETHVRDMHRLRDRVKALYDISQRGGEAKVLLSTDLASALADAELAKYRVVDLPQVTFETRPPDASDLTRIMYGCWDPTLDGPEFFPVFESLKRFEEMSAARHNDFAERLAVRVEWSNETAKLCNVLRLYPEYDGRYPQGTRISMCLCVMDKLDVHGRRFFDGTLGDFCDEIATRERARHSREEKGLTPVVAPMPAPRLPSGEPSQP
jgi:hypothetical protein